jgi:hypothetical protein
VPIISPLNERLLREQPLSSFLGFTLYNETHQSIRQALIPGHLKNDLGEYVSLELDTDKPHLFNEEHIKKYSSKQSNSGKRKMNFFTKLWILMFAR